jgi:hypothetical protein
MHDRVALAYVAAWLASTTSGVIVALRHRSAYSLTQPVYLQFLGQRWKVVTFAIAAAAFTLVAPYTGDPTWDHVDAPLMSLLTFTTAPWTVGVVYRIVRKREPVERLFVAANAWLFTASWSYDGYLLLRDGRYPSTWALNLVVSSVLYFLAGLFWNLEWIPERGVVFAFMLEKWPCTESRSSFARVAGLAVLCMVLVSMMIGYFVLDYLRSAPR